MDNKERLKELKVLQITDKNERTTFGKHELLMSWVDNVAPLLKYSNEHYTLFMDAASKVSVPRRVSSRTAIPCLNIMKSVVNRAIIELENNIESPTKPATSDKTTNPPDAKAPHGKSKKSISLINIAEGVIIGALMLCIGWILFHYFNLRI
ncbi:MAG: hypothetical protein OEY59_12030 [Deltaproteobacteria bacterium]|nr:hypothetical protein [Deltaproteobacteria bacterium]